MDKMLKLTILANNEIDARQEAYDQGAFKIIEVNEIWKVYEIVIIAK